MFDFIEIWDAEVVMSGQPRLLVIGAACCVLALAGWGLYGLIFRYAPVQDFMVFYMAARSCLDGNMGLLSDGTLFTEMLNERFGAWLSHPLGLHPWVYPPLFLLMVMPLGLMPFWLSLVLFLAGTFLLLNLALRPYLPRTDQRRICLASLALSPASAFTVAVGQNAFLTTALLVGGFGLVRRAPALGGAMLGVLAFKPQLWLMVPIALVAARQWRAFGSALTAMALLAAASVLVLGLALWQEWFALLLRPNLQHEHWLKVGRLNGQSAYADAILLGLPVGAARLTQAAAVLLSAALVWWTFRTSRIRYNLKVAILLTATILAAPHVSNYDAVMVTVAASLFLCDVLDNGARFGDAILFVVVWGIELFDLPLVFRLGFVMPLVYGLFAAALLARPTVPEAGRRHPTATMLAGRAADA